MDRAKVSPSPAAPATIRAAAPFAVLAAAGKRGLARAAVLEAAAVSGLPEDPRAVLPLSVHFAIFAASIRLADDPGFPIDVAREVWFDAYDVMGFAIRSAPTLLAAIEVSRRFQGLYSSGGLYDLEVDDASVVLRYRPSGALPLAARCATESAIAQAVHLGRSIAGGELTVREVRFRHPRPRETKRHDDFFGVPPIWDAAFTELRFARRDLDRPVITADPGLHAFLARTAEDALAALPAPASIADEVRRAVLDGLPSGRGDLPQVARALGVSPRTLRRRLDEQGATFTVVRDGVRRDLAERYLAERDLPIPEIAFLLDFADERAFRRSFRRWTGGSPAAFRRDRATSR